MLGGIGGSSNTADDELPEAVRLCGAEESEEGVHECGEERVHLLLAQLRQRGVQVLLAQVLHGVLQRVEGPHHPGLLVVLARLGQVQVLDQDGQDL